MPGTMGDSTRGRLAGAIQAANAGGGGGDKAGGQYYGGFGGGLAGTWGKSATGRGELGQKDAGVIAGGANR